MVLSQINVNFIETSKYGEDKYFNYQAILKADQELTKEDFDIAVKKFQLRKEKLLEKLTDGTYSELFSELLDELSKLGYTKIEFPTQHTAIEVDYTL